MHLSIYRYSDTIYPLHPLAHSHTYMYMLNKEMHTHTVVHLYNHMELFVIDE